MKSDATGQQLLLNEYPTNNPSDIDLSTWPISVVLPQLLEDKTTKKNIILATEGYWLADHELEPTTPITIELLNQLGATAIRPRVCKNHTTQAERTHTKAEVATPAWICNKMNNMCDETWFARKNVFNTEGDKTWCTNKAPINFPPRKSWKRYVDSKRIEITCGEAPFLVSRYDAATGSPISVCDRVGILDRKLRIVSENTGNYDEWCIWAQRAIESIYGYEYQGDNLLIARINILLSYIEHMYATWGKLPTKRALKKIATRIAWNIWQMNGLTGTTVTGKSSTTAQASTPMELFECMSLNQPFSAPNFSQRCKIHDWRAKLYTIYNNISRTH